MPATTERQRRHPRAMAPPMVGPGVRSFSEARRHHKGLWHHFICQSAAAATLQIKGGGAAQGAHPPPGPPDGVNDIHFLASTIIAGRSVPGSGGLHWRRPRRRGVAVAARINLFLATVMLATATTRLHQGPECSARPVKRKGHDKLRSFSGAPFRAKQLLPYAVVFFA